MFLFACLIIFLLKTGNFRKRIIATLVTKSSVIIVCLVIDLFSNDGTNYVKSISPAVYSHGCP